MLTLSYFEIELVLAGILAGSLVTGFGLRSALKRRTQHALERDKDRFVGLASHYLLTPLTGLQAGLDLLYESHNLDLAARERLYAALKRSETRLSLTVQQLVLASQLTSDPLKITVKPASLASITAAAITALDPFSRQKSVTLRMKDGNADLQVKLDPRYARQAVSAVLDNAIKFSPENAVVNLEVGSTPEYAFVIISDRGPGMSAATVSKSATKFFRGTDLYQFDYEGIGLGLYVTKEIMEAHGGTLEVDSSPGNGTQVTLRFPNR